MKVMKTAPATLRSFTVSLIPVIVAAVPLTLDVGFVFGPGPTCLVRLVQLGVAALVIPWPAGWYPGRRSAGKAGRKGEGLRRLPGALFLVPAVLAERPGPEGLAFFPGLGPVVILVRLILLVYLVGAGFRLLRRTFRVAPSPHAMVALSFLFLILAGTGALLLPTATHGRLAPNISLVDALFTATSAVCVTGLIVLDTAVDFSRFGQTVILLLIQLGGLGIMAYVGVFIVSMRQGSSLKDTQLLRDAFNAESFSRIKHLLKLMLLATFGAELLGLAALMAGFRALPLPERWFHAAFQSVSAFCNAGFSSFSNSLEDFSGNATVILTVGVLIILGGLGFHVVLEIATALAERLRPGGRRSRGRPRGSVHMRLVLGGTGVLLAVGFGGVLAGSDWGGVGVGERLLSSFFQSLTTRTAGFNSMPMSALSTPVMVLFMALMFIGGAPGGTAGGIKVSTVGLLYYSSLNLARGRTSVEILRRSIPPQLVQMAFVLTGMALTFVAGAFTLLCAFEPHLPFRDLLFEVISAFGTVGLSLGVTPELSDKSRLLLCLVMFCGRTGPLTIFLAFVRKRDEALYAYPPESIVIG